MSKKSCANCQNGEKKDGKIVCIKTGKVIVDLEPCAEHKQRNK